MNKLTRDEIIAWCLTLPDTCADYPFDDPDMMVVRHQDNRKWFALFFYLQEELCINVKAVPSQGAALCDVYEGITPGWHMNKRQWITIYTNRDVPYGEIQELLKESYRLTSTKKKQK